MEELVRIARAHLLLDIELAANAALRGGGPPIRVELLLSNAGFAHKEIGALLGKSPAAVAKAVSRARATRQDGVEPSETNRGEAQ